MLSFFIAFLILAAGVAAIYLILKKMCEDGTDIAAPGSCRSKACGPSCRPQRPAQDDERAEEADATPPEPPKG